MLQLLPETIAESSGTVRSRSLIRPVLLALSISLFLTACGKKTPRVTAPPTPAPTPAPTTPPPVAAPAPQLSARVEPNTISTGESASLVWEAENAETIFIDHSIGEVDQSGVIKVFPAQTTTYRIVAVGPGGTTERSIRLRVFEQKMAHVPDEALAGRTLEERFAYFVKPVFFDHNSGDLESEAKLTLDGNIRWLMRPENRHIGIVLEGHTDPLGTAEYNLALGDRRAQVVRAYLVGQGVAQERITTVSVGEEQPPDPGTTEEAYAFNRRVQFLLKQEQPQP